MGSMSCDASVDIVVLASNSTAWGSSSWVQKIFTYFHSGWDSSGGKGVQVFTPCRRATVSHNETVHR